MIRHVTVLSAVLALPSGFYLYAGKHRTAVIDREIATTMQATQAAHARSRLLQGEWSILNEPERLKKLSARYLALVTAEPAQFVQLSDLQNHLPSVQAGSPDDAAGDMATIASAALPAPLPAHADVPKLDVHLGTQPRLQHPAAVAKSELAAKSEPPRMPASRPMERYWHPPAQEAVTPRPEYRFAPPPPPQTPTARPYIESALGGRPSLPPPIPLNQ